MFIPFCILGEDNLWLVDKGILLPLKENSMFSMLPVLEKNKISAFSGLNDISHLLDQAFSSSRSWLNTVFIWSTLWLEYPSDVSSANNVLNDIIFSPISFIYIRNMRGPNTDPWGIPAETGSKLDQEFLLITFCLLLNR